MKIEVDGKENVDLYEFQKAISFISEDIESYAISSGQIVLEINDKADCEEIKRRTIDLLDKYVINNKSSKYFENYVTQNYVGFEKLSCIYKFEDGMLELKNEALLLFKYFEQSFRKMAHSLDSVCEERLYPVLLPVTEYKKTGYLRNSPQYALLCSSVHEDIEELEELNDNVDTIDVKRFIKQPMYALSPSACFHSYIELKNRCLEEKKILTFTQSVFRNEGRFNYKDLGRLRDYHVREIVFLGDKDYVKKKRKELMDLVVQFVQDIGLCGEMVVASDPFIMPQLQRYKKIQMIENVKYELRINYSNVETMSVASFNLHGTSFTYPFRISIKNVSQPVTGCVGFGLERWVLTFLAQYGENISNWPICVQKGIESIN